MRFGLEVLIGLCVGTIPVIVLRTALSQVMLDLCGTDARARFWARYTWTMLYIAPVLFATFPDRETERGEPIDQAFVESTFQNALLGVFIALIVVGFHLARFTRAQQNATRTMAPS